MSNQTQPAPVQRNPKTFKRDQRIIWTSKSLGLRVIGEIVTAGVARCEIRYTFAGTMRTRWVSNHELEHARHEA